MISDFFTTQFTVYRQVWSTDGQGNEYAAEQSIGTFMGHLQQAGPEYAQNVGLSMTKAFTVWCPVGTDVKDGDTLYTDTETFTVKGVMKNNVGDNAHLELVVQLEGEIEGS